MTAYNVVRFRVKEGHQQEFIDAHHAMANLEMEGNRRFTLVRTGDRTFCAIGEWNRMEDLVHARTTMIGALDTFRAMLEDLGDGLGVTDPVAGEAVVELTG